MHRFTDIDGRLKNLPSVDDFHNEEVVSIDKALHSVESKIVHLSHLINIAKRSCHYPNKHGLSRDQSASIYIYAMELRGASLSRALNQALRSEDRRALQIWFPYLKLFYTALDLLPTVNASVWRGISSNIAEYFPRHEIFTWSTISSCLLTLEAIEEVLQNEKNSTLFLIQTRNGKDISDYTPSFNQREVILKIDTRFQVVDKTATRPDGSHLVHLLEVDNKCNDQQLLPTAIRKSNHQWKPRGKMIAGGNGSGSGTGQLICPTGICIDDVQQTIYIADWGNCRIVQWKLGDNKGQIVVEGMGIDHFKCPTDVKLDRNSESLIIADRENRRILRCSLKNRHNIETLISHIDCWGLMINEEGDLFVTDRENHQVKKWRKGEKEGTVIAGGNGKGYHLNQLNSPTFIFVDQQETIYVSDYANHRVMKWLKNAKEGIRIAGTSIQGNSFRQLSYPDGLVVDEIGNVYIADAGNHRIMCWPLGSREGRLVLGGNGQGKRLNQFDYIAGITFDSEKNLYVADHGNSRVLRFELIQNQ